MSQFVAGGLFVVRRPFKACGVLHNVGEVIEDPTELKLFRSRLGDRDIIELLPEQETVNLSWLEYMEARATEAIDSRVYALAGKEDPNEVKPVDEKPADSVVPPVIPTGTKVEKVVIAAKAPAVKAPATTK